MATNQKDKSTFDSPGAGATHMGEKAGNQMKAAGQKVGDEAKRMGERAGDEAKRMGERTGEEAKRWGDKIGDAAKQAGEKVGDQAENVATAVVHKAEDAASFVSHKAGDAASFVGQKADDATTTVGKKMESIGGAIREHTPGMLSGAGNAVAESLEHGGQYLEQHNLKEIGDDVTNMIRRNPVPAVLIGIGVGFLLARAIRS